MTRDDREQSVRTEKVEPTYHQPEDFTSKLHDYTTRILENEIELFWKRSSFFWLFTGSAFVGFGVLWDKADKDLPLAIACFGLICSLSWTLANRGTKYWQYVWEQKLKSVQRAALGRLIYFEGVSRSDPAGPIWGASRYSVTKLAIALSDFSVLIWLTLGVKASPLMQARPWEYVPIVLVLGTILYALAILVGTRSSSRDELLPPSN